MEDHASDMMRREHEFLHPKARAFEVVYLRTRIPKTEQMDKILESIVKVLADKYSIQADDSQINNLIMSEPSSIQDATLSYKIKHLLLEHIDFDALKYIIRKYWYDHSTMEAIQYLMINLMIVDRKDTFYYVPIKTPDPATGEISTKLRPSNLASRFIQINSNLSDGRYGAVYRVHPITSQFPFILKTVPGSENNQIAYHESTVARLIINPLRKLCPNFAMSLGNFSCGKSYWGNGSVCNMGSEKLTYTFIEYVPGRTLLEEVKSKKLSDEDLISIFLQMIFAIKIAHNSGNYEFVHNDLHLSNILLRPLDEYRIIAYDEYYMSKNPSGKPGDKVYYVKTKFCPTVIDYGLSQFVHPLGDEEGKLHRVRLEYNHRHGSTFSNSEYKEEPFAPVIDFYIFLQRFAYFNFLNQQEEYWKLYLRLFRPQDVGGSKYPRNRQLTGEIPKDFDPKSMDIVNLLTLCHEMLNSDIISMILTTRDSKSSKDVEVFFGERLLQCRGLCPDVSKIINGSINPKQINLMVGKNIVAACKLYKISRNVELLESLRGRLSEVVHYVTSNFNDLPTVDGIIVIPALRNTRSYKVDQVALYIKKLVKGIYSFLDMSNVLTLWKIIDPVNSEAYIDKFKIEMAKVIDLYNDYIYPTLIRYKSEILVDKSAPPAADALILKYINNMPKNLI